MFSHSISANMKTEQSGSNFYLARLPQVIIISQRSYNPLYIGMEWVGQHHIIYDYVPARTVHYYISTGLFTLCVLCVLLVKTGVIGPFPTSIVMQVISTPPD